MTRPDFVCPQCHGVLETRSNAYHCAACNRPFPVVLGIADFRLHPDPYISFDDEYRKAERLAHAAVDKTFEELLRYYWEITPDVSRQAAERYVRYAAQGKERGLACFEAMDARLQRRWRGDSLLEVGCGTGGLLLPAAERFSSVVGSDIAFRWLVIARKQLEETGSDAVLVCCSAERLPFTNARFDAVVGLHVLEHSQDPAAVIANSARVLKSGGRCLFPTPNRYSLGPEPCVRVWGVGFLPRRFMGRYVQWVKGMPYRHIRLLSWFELRRYLRAAGFAHWRIDPHRFAECELRAASPRLRTLVRLYHALLTIPGMPQLMRLLGPMHQITASK